jgi:NAD(P)-dependent dehydrogenase (short-subunit alcohol dehydrogenase family)
MKTSQIVLLTGATSGLGLQTVAQLAQRPDIDVVVGARNPRKAHELRSLIPTARLTILPLDLTSFASVQDFARETIAHLGDRQLSAIALNAGIQILTGLKKTAEGHECTFASHYLGHFLLVGLLLPRLSATGVIISTASGTHDPQDPLATRAGFQGGLFPSAEAVVNGILDDTVSQRQQGLDRYATAKLCNLLFIYDMAKRIPPTQARFVAFDPGLMPGTGLARDYSLVERVIWRYILPVLQWFVPGVSSPSRSAKVLARLLTEPELVPSTGLHLDYRLRQTPTSKDSYHEDWQQALYAMGVKLTGCAIASD